MTKKYVLLFLLACASFNSIAQKTDKRVLIFTKTNRYYHESIPDGVKAIQKLGLKDQFMVDTTSNGRYFTEENLKKYAAVIFLSTSGDNVLDTMQKTDFRRYIEAGGGFMGIHCAAATEKIWPWYGQLVGAVFTNHPDPQQAVVVVEDRKNESTKHLPAKWTRQDEWYNFKNRQDGLHILLTVDESTYKGGTNGKYHPLAWYREFDGGRSFYTALGHFSDHFVDPLYVKHIEAGIIYAIGKNAPLNYSKVSTPKFSGN